MSNKMFFTVFILMIVFMVVAPDYCFADVEGSLNNIKTMIFRRLLPIVAVLGIGFAGFSLITGNPNAKIHLVSAIVGSVIAFGAQAIVDLVSSLVR